MAATALAFALTTGAAACTTRASGVPAHAPATHDDPEFTATFQLEFADVEGVRTHYVKGGSGSPVVLLHGWPQTWCGWWPILLELAEHHTRLDESRGGDVPDPDVAGTVHGRRDRT